MSDLFDRLTDDHRAFIAEQHLFFVATAPAEGRINISPKGMDTFRVLDERTVAYLDLTGSGNETAAHLLENGRITLMLCSFAKKPRILRIYGRGEVLRSPHAVYESIRPEFPDLPGERHIMQVTIESVQSSCGYAVPRFEYAGERDSLVKWAAKKGERALAGYRRKNNARSLDGRAIYEA